MEGLRRGERDDDEQVRRPSGTTVRRVETQVTQRSVRQRSAGKPVRTFVRAYYYTVLCHRSLVASEMIAENSINLSSRSDSDDEFDGLLLFIFVKYAEHIVEK